MSSRMAHRPIELKLHNVRDKVANIRRVVVNVRLGGRIKCVTWAITAARGLDALVSES